MDELKKKIKKFYIMFGIEAPAAFFLLVLFNHYIRKSFSDIGETILENFGLKQWGIGTSFLEKLSK